MRFIRKLGFSSLFETGNATRLQHQRQISPVFRIHVVASETLLLRCVTVHRKRDLDRGQSKFSFRLDTAN